MLVRHNASGQCYMLRRRLGLHRDLATPRDLIQLDVVGVFFVKTFIV